MLIRMYSISLSFYDWELFCVSHFHRFFFARRIHQSSIYRVVQKKQHKICSHESQSHSLHHFHQNVQNTKKKILNTSFNYSLLRNMLLTYYKTSVLVTRHSWQKYGLQWANSELMEIMLNALTKNILSIYMKFALNNLSKITRLYSKWFRIYFMQKSSIDFLYMPVSVTFYILIIFSVP